MTINNNSEIVPWGKVEKYLLKKKSEIDQKLYINWAIDALKYVTVYLLYYGSTSWFY